MKGTGSAGRTGDEGQATSATLAELGQIHGDIFGNLYSAQYNSDMIRVIKIDTGIITRFCGTGTGGGIGDGGRATAAQVNGPYGVWADTVGNVYVAEQGGFRIRKVDSNSIITKIAGTGVSTSSIQPNGIQATSSGIYRAQFIFGDLNQQLFYADSERDIVRMINLGDGTVVTYAGTGTASETGENVQATAATLSNPYSQWADTLGNLFISSNSGTVRKVTSDGIITTVAGQLNGATGTSGNNGPATSALLTRAYGTFVDTSGLVYFTDTDYAGVRVLSTFDPTATPTMMPSLSREPSLKPTTATPTAPTAMPTTELDANLVAYFPFDGNALDAGPYKHGTTVSGAALAPDRYGKANSAYRFSASTHYIQITYSSLLEVGTGDFSLSVWVKRDTLGGNQRVFSHGNNGCSVAGYLLMFEDTNKALSSYACGGTPCVQPELRTTAQVLTGVWTHMVYTVQRNVATKWYINGVLDSTLASPSNCDATNAGEVFMIGTRISNSEPFKGSIDELRIYRRALSASDVTQLYRFLDPTVQPSLMPTFAPSPSMSPSTVPSIAPSVVPSQLPSMFPSAAPSVPPSVTPSVAPSIAPSTAPTVTPSVTPSFAPSILPSKMPSIVPSMTPSALPSVTPSVMPSILPSKLPSIVPSTSPSTVPSAVPVSTETPSTLSTQIPSLKPTTSIPTAPTAAPSVSLMPTSELDVDLVAYFPFDGNALDAGPYKHGTTVSGAALAPDRYGTANSAYRFSASGHYIQIAYSSLLEVGTGDFSLSVWVKRDTVGSNQRVFSHGNIGCALSGYLLMFETTNVVLSSYTCGSTCTRPELRSTAKIATVGVWVHLVYTVQRNIATTWYINGVFDSTVAAPSDCDVTNANEPYMIGTRTASGTEQFRGSIDELRIYRRALSASDVTQLYRFIDPTAQPSVMPTFAPSQTMSPSVVPSAAPTVSPSVTPSFGPSIAPSATPSTSPSMSPSVAPSFGPSIAPSATPSMSPSVAPSFGPSVAPSATPSAAPVGTEAPSVAPVPSEAPSAALVGSPAFSVRNALSFSAITVDGRVYSWGHAGSGGDSSSVSNLLVNVTSVVSCVNAYAALKTDGSVVAWGEASSIAGSMVYRSYTTITSLIANERAFAGIADGAVITFGVRSYGGVNGLDGFDEYLSANVDSLAATAFAIAALKSDGTVYAWGNKFGGGGASTLTMSSLQNVVQLFGTHSSFAALKVDGTVVMWGDRASGGSASFVPANVATILSGRSYFVALDDDQSASIWGGSGMSYVSNELVSGVSAVFTTDGASAVIKTHGSVVTWGDEDMGGDSSSVISQLENVTHIYSNRRAFAALTASGSVIAWGDSKYGGSIASVASLLTSSVTKIVSTNFAFAALKTDGSVVTWGSKNYGGDSSAVTLTNVRLICANEVAFTASKNDNSVVVWGHKQSVTTGVLNTTLDFSVITSC